MPEKVRWGILGTANIAKKALIPALLKTPEAQLFSIAGRNAEKLKDFENEFKPKRIYDSYHKMLEDKDVDAVYIPLPNSMHLEWAVRAMESKKHVLCEKPLGMTAEQIISMKEVSVKNKVLLMEAFAYINNPLIKKIKELTSGGKIGDLKSISVVFSFDLTKRPKDIRWFKKLGGGATYDLGCYAVHVSRYISGLEPEDVLATGEIEKGVTYGYC